MRDHEYEEQCFYLFMRNVLDPKILVVVDQMLEEGMAITFNSLSKYYQANDIEYHVHFNLFHNLRYQLVFKSVHGMDIVLSSLWVSTLTETIVQLK